MNIEVEALFWKEIRQLKNKTIKHQVLQFIEALEQATSLGELKQIKKLTSKKCQAYRFRIGDYRIGFYLKGEAVVLARCLHRKEIYRYFP